MHNAKKKTDDRGKGLDISLLDSHEELVPHLLLPCRDQSALLISDRHGSHTTLGQNMLFDPMTNYCFARNDLLACLGRRENLNRLKKMITSK